jgi:Invasion associated locus B (IalB) protein
MIRLAHLPILVIAAALGLAAADHALAQQQNSADAKKKAAKPSPADDKTNGAAKADSKPLLVASFGDWGVYQTQAGKGRVCYTLAQPKDRIPSNLNRDPAYAFISDRPSEGVRNEVSFIMGFDVANPTEEAKSDDKAEKSKAKASKTTPVKEATATVNDQTFELLAKSTNLWVKNAAKEGQLIDEMRKGAKLEVRATSKKGNMTTDTYSLSGFSQALERVLKDCPSGK